MVLSHFFLIQWTKGMDFSWWYHCVPPFVSCYHYTGVKLLAIWSSIRVCNIYHVSVLFIIIILSLLGYLRSMSSHDHLGMGTCRCSLTFKNQFQSSLQWEISQGIKNQPFANKECSLEQRTCHPERRSISPEQCPVPGVIPVIGLLECHVTYVPSCKTNFKHISEVILISFASILHLPCLPLTF